MRKEEWQEISRKIGISGGLKYEINQWKIRYEWNNMKLIFVFGGLSMNFQVDHPLI